MSFIRKSHVSLCIIKYESVNCKEFSVYLALKVNASDSIYNHPQSSSKVDDGSSQKAYHKSELSRGIKPSNTHHVIYGFPSPSNNGQYDILFHQLFISITGVPSGNPVSVNSILYWDNSNLELFHCFIVGAQNTTPNKNIPKITQ